jgi:pSer/pThr/pTyr-binding forkhead associated (FHA) protein
LLAEEPELMRAQLIPLQGGAAIDVLKDVTLVGRKEDCDLRLEHKSVSKLHCIIVKTDGLLLLRDLGSTNGTRVNGQRIRRAALLPNDQVTIACFSFRVHLGADEASPSSEERTQNIASHFDHLNTGPAPVVDSALDMPVQPVQNPLPDVYPGQNGRMKDKG